MSTKQKRFILPEDEIPKYWYKGDVTKYGKELSQKNQLLNGEYGAWRSIDLHTEPGEFEVNGVWSESRMCQLMETKIRLAEQAKDSVCGQFQWIFSSHDNPGCRLER